MDACNDTDFKGLSVVSTKLCLTLLDYPMKESNVWNFQIKISTQHVFRITVSIFFPFIFGGTGKWKKGNKIKKYFQGIKSQLHQTLAYPLEKKFLDMWTRDNNLAAPSSYLVWSCSLHFPVGMKTESEPAGDPGLRMPSQGARQGRWASAGGARALLPKGLISQTLSFSSLKTITEGNQRPTEVQDVNSGGGAVNLKLL